MNENRKFMRFGCAINVRYRLLEKPDSESITFTQDVGKEGVRLSVQRKLKEGTDLEMIFDIPGDGAPLFAQGKVLWVSRIRNAESGFFDVGIKFSKIDDFDRSRFIGYVYDQWLGVIQKNIK